MGDIAFIPGVPAEATQVTEPGARSESVQERLFGIGDEIAEALRNAGFITIDDIRVASDAQLLAIPGIGKARLEAIRAALKEEEVNHG